MIGIDSGSEAAKPGSEADEAALREFQPVSGTTPVGRSRRRPRDSILAWVDSHGLAVAGLMTVLAAVAWLIGGAGSDRQPDLDRKDAEIRRLSKQVSELNGQLASVSKAKGEAERGLQAAQAEARGLEAQLAETRADFDKAKAEVEKLKTQLAASSSPAVDPSLPAEAVEILAQPLLENSIGMKLKLIPAGTFMMGSNDGDGDEKPVHEVRITKPFYLGVTEVTNAQWKRVMGGEPPSKWKDDQRPVEQVSWDEAVAFCQKLSGMPEERSGRPCVSPADRGGVGICVPGRHDDQVVSGDDEARLATSHGLARTATARPTRWARRSQRLGSARHAWQCVGVVQRLVRAVPRARR